MDVFRELRQKLKQREDPNRPVPPRRFITKVAPLDGGEKKVVIVKDVAMQTTFATSDVGVQTEISIRKKIRGLQTSREVRGGLEAKLGDISNIINKYKTKELKN